MQYITVYTPNSVHSNQTTPSTPMTVSLVAFRRNLLPLLIRWRLSSGHCANLRNFRSPDKALVFTPLSSPAPKEDSTRFSLYAPSGPGLSEQDPIALVVESEKRTEEVSQSEKLPERSDDTRYPLRQVLSTSPTQIVHSSALQCTIAFTYQGKRR
jgi:hypothetical protein